jgi:ribosomal protein RSM22 (predicted rRNA methylase)
MTPAQVVVEPGTPLGFKIVREGRELLLSEFGRRGEADDEPQAHVIAPVRPDARACAHGY